MPALVERHLQVDRRAVERHVGVAQARQLRDADFAESEVAHHPILAGGGAERERRLVEVGVRERPEARARSERKREPGFASAGLNGPARLGERRIAHGSRRHPQLEGGARGGGLGEPHAQLDALQPDARVELERLHVERRARFEVDRLPQAPCLPVALLALQLEGVRRVVHAQDQPLVLPGLCDLRQLQLEGRVAPLVGADGLSVEPAARLPVGGAHHEEDPPPAPALRYPQRPRVPRDVGLVRDARQLRAPGERHLDPERKRLGGRSEPALALARGVPVEAKGPLAVQVDPLRALEVGPRVLGQRDLRPGSAARDREEGEHQPGGEEHEAAESHRQDLQIAEAP